MGEECLDMSLSRTALIQRLKEAAKTRRELAEKVDIKELWEILHEESDEINLPTMTLFCFDPPLTAHHEAAVVRAFFNDRIYFKYTNEIFLPYTPRQVEGKKRQIRETERRERLIQNGAAWLTAMQKGGDTQPDPAVVEVLKGYYLFGSDAPQASAARKILRKSGMNTPDPLFHYFVKMGIWNEHENIDLLSMQIPTTFSPNAQAEAKKLCTTHAHTHLLSGRKDLTRVPLITIDGQSTLDYDDAI
ncbi:MAG: ribonuclease II, partial [Desulfobacterales bacterium]|nr:ribonuclease II [Desulfobacterales bacterium]